MSTVRVRFAPSPTGHLHIGGARTALFNWLFARSQGGVFVFRIEDTDTTRSTDEYIESILQSMTWLGLDWDEGPFRQTDRFDVYKQYIDKLLTEGKAYHCYCPPDELEARRKEAQEKGLPMQYDRRCRERTEPVEGVQPVVRFKMPLEGQVKVMDLIKGGVTFDNAQLDDFIIARSDGTPTYNFVVVADDVDMGITHVIRGDDHLNNTPKQLHIYRALGAKEPIFAHLPMILGADKTRLSKRHGATSVTAYRDDGYLPQALLNYLARLGWSHGDQEIFSKEELIKYFSFESVGKSAAVFNPEKLLWLNAEYLKATPLEELATLVIPFLVREGFITEGAALDMAWLAKAVSTQVERAKTLVELANSLRYYILKGDEFDAKIEFDHKAKEKFLNEKSLDVLKAMHKTLQGTQEFKHDALEEAFKALMEKLDLKLGKLAQPLRVALTGGTQSPGIFEVLEIVGKDESLRRLNKAISEAGP
jgi:glutamyl-tRNA synthetase